MKKRISQIKERINAKKEERKLINEQNTQAIKEEEELDAEQVDIT